jgi:hypothetical protein
MNDLSKIRDDTRSLYAATKPIDSPALHDRVAFTAEGFSHIIFKGSRRERERSS